MILDSNSPLGPGPETKSQGTGLKNIVTIARYAGKKASLDIRRAVPLFVLDIRTNKDKGLALALSQSEATERTKEHNRAYCYLFRSKMKEKPVFLLYFAHLFVSLPPVTTNHRCIWTSIIHEVCGNHIVFRVLPVW